MRAQSVAHPPIQARRDDRASLQRILSTPLLIVRIRVQQLDLFIPR